MKILTIGTDRDIFKEGSAVRARAVQYGGLFEEQHIIVFSKRNFQYPISNIQQRNKEIKKVQISSNMWAYPTDSINKLFYIRDAIKIGKSILTIPSTLNPKPFVISAQDPSECGFVAWRLAKKFNLKFQLQIHTDIFSPYFAKHSFLNRIRVFLAKFLIPKANGIRVVSERIKNSLTNNQQLTTNNITILPIWSDVEKIKQIEPDKNFRDKYKHWDFIIVMASRLAKEKNIGLALEVLQDVVKKHPKTGLVIVGSGPEEPSLRLQATSYQLQASVAFEGWVPKEKLISCFKSADLFLQTSFYEGFGLSLLEAVLSGLPAVSSNAGIAPELLSFSGESFVCKPNDKNCFVYKINKLIEDSEFRKVFNLAGMAQAEHFTIKNEADYLTAYKKALEM